jgi:hypothetical protein
MYYAGYSEIRECTILEYYESDIDTDRANVKISWGEGSMYGSANRLFYSKTNAERYINLKKEMQNLRAEDLSEMITALTLANSKSIK